MRKIGYGFAVLSMSAILALTTLPSNATKADTVKTTEWSTERITNFDSNTSVVEEVKTEYIYERYLWYNNKTSRATGVRLLPSNYKFNKIVSGSNSYSGAGKGTNKYNIRRSVAYDTPIAEDKNGGYTVKDSTGKVFHAWSYYTRTMYRYTISIKEPTGVENELKKKAQNYIDTVVGTPAKEWGGGDGTQCVEVCKHFIDTVFGCDSHYKGIGNGNTLYKGIARQYSDKFTAIDYYDGFIPEPGDILSLLGSDKRYGHSVLVKSVNVQAGTMVVIEQWKGSKTVRERTIPIQGKDSGTKNGIIGCARAK